MIKNSQLNKLFNNARLWQPEAQALRDILLATGLSEEIKWGKPCYTHDGHNICIIQRMKGFLALLFFKGALLKDPDGVLERQGPNSHMGYRMCFTCLQEVTSAANSVRAYVREAIDIEESGLTMEKAPDREYPEELANTFANDPEYKTAFDRLTPGRRRGYIMHFSDAKQSKTRITRIEKYRQQIMQGKGFQER